MRLLLQLDRVALRRWREAEGPDAVAGWWRDNLLPPAQLVQADSIVIGETPDGDRVLCYTAFGAGPGSRIRDGQRPATLRVEQLLRTEPWGLR